MCNKRAIQSGDLSSFASDRTGRCRLISDAAELISNDRQEQYGDALESFERIAALWGAYLNVEVSAVDVANMMTLLKVSRAKGSPTHKDSYIDMIGYAALAGEMALSEEA